MIYIFIVSYDFSTCGRIVWEVLHYVAKSSMFNLMEISKKDCFLFMLQKKKKPLDYVDLEDEHLQPIRKALEVRLYSKDCKIFTNKTVYLLRDKE